MIQVSDSWSGLKNQVCCVAFGEPPLNHTGQFRDNWVIRNHFLLDQSCLQQLFPKCLPQVTCHHWHRVPLKSSEYISHSVCSMNVSMSDRHKKGMSQSTSLLNQRTNSTSILGKPQLKRPQEPKELCKPHICGQEMTTTEMTDTFNTLCGKMKLITPQKHPKRVTLKQAESAIVCDLASQASSLYVLLDPIFQWVQRPTFFHYYSPLHNSFHDNRFSSILAI